MTMDMATGIANDTPALLDTKLKQAQYQFDPDLHSATLSMCPKPRPCFNLALLQEIRSFQQAVAKHVKADIDQYGHTNLQYTILASNIPGIYNLGGDLHLFLDLIQKKDRDELLKYAIACIDAGYQFSISMDLPITTIALVQGHAQGGGFEAALSCNVIIAEAGALLGFPEVLFNLFPGMGAYSYLRQRVNPILAEQMILSGKLYRAEELYELGVVDILAEPGKGTQELREYIRHADRRSNAHALIRHTRRHSNEVSYEELLDITNLWVDSAMNINERELKIMNRLVRAQNRKVDSIEKNNNLMGNTR